MDQKAEEQIFKGIHYIRISMLPEEQSEPFVMWLPQDQIIKIQIDHEILHDCVQYHHYEHWFDNIRATLPETQSETSGLGISIQ